MCIQLFIHDSPSSTSNEETFISRNFEVNASEVKKNLEEWFSRYYMHIDISLTIQQHNSALIVSNTSSIKHHQKHQT